MIQVPIFHVNGDEPEAVVHCVKLAMECRQRFGQDVVIDMVCYRRHGHNEGDEPSFTQPLLYEKIRNKESVRKLYTEQLLARGILQRADVERIEADLLGAAAPGPRSHRDEARPGPTSRSSRAARGPASRAREPATDPATAVAGRAARAARGAPGDDAARFRRAPEARRDARAAAQGGGRGRSRSTGGSARRSPSATLLLEGSSVRLSGQDSCRGTFSHRHAALVDQKTGEEYVPLAHLSPQQARFEVYDSLLSEAAVLGFEYGYSVADPLTLTIWEAQFGDFANGAQVIIDQFIVVGPRRSGSA